MRWRQSGERRRGFPARDDGLAERHRLERRSTSAASSVAPGATSTGRRMPTSSTRAGPGGCGHSDASPRADFGGVFGGGNLQLGQWIFGAELSYSGTGLSQSTTQPVLTRDRYLHDRAQLAGTVEGRIGYSWDRTMVFVKGGWAGGNATLALNDNARRHRASTDIRRRLDHRRRRRICGVGQRHPRPRVRLHHAQPQRRSGELPAVRGPASASARLPSISDIKISIGDGAR